MTIIEITLIGIGLAMDAFAASICKGLSLKRITLNNILIIALYFSIFQSIMPLLGYILGTNFNNFLLIINHLISFTILTMIGLNMIIESLSKQEKEISSIINFKTMIPLSFATSIDAFTVGITFALLKTNIILSIIIIGIITLLLTFIGVILGNKFGTKYKRHSEFLGGLILIIIAIKTIIEHLI